MIRMQSHRLLLLASFLLAGCPKPPPDPSPADECKKPGQQCATPPAEGEGPPPVGSNVPPKT